MRFKQDADPRLPDCTSVGLSRDLGPTKGKLAHVRPQLGHSQAWVVTLPSFIVVSTSSGVASKADDRRDDSSWLQAYTCAADALSDMSRESSMARNELRRRPSGDVPNNTVRLYGSFRRYSIRG